MLVRCITGGDDTALVVQKSVPMLLYGFEVCVLPTRTSQALDFTMNCVLMKLFKTSNIDKIAEYRCFFRVKLPSVQLPKRCQKFLSQL